MRRIIVLALFLCSVSTLRLTAQVQTEPGLIVSKENVTIEMVKAIFENSFYEILKTDATYIQIKDTYNIYIDLSKDNRYLVFSVNWPIEDSSSSQDKLLLLNMISKDVLLVTPYYNEGGTSLIVKATVWIEGGATVKNIVLAEKIYVKALNLILEKDTKKIIK
ncbi:MAG: hypothetical protein NTW10_13100 [Bacteroidetes bacterium]|nr:hypothetical protein [Bacteroidota bacterium]